MTEKLYKDKIKFYIKAKMRYLCNGILFKIGLVSMWSVP